MERGFLSAAATPCPSKARSIEADIGRSPRARLLTMLLPVAMIVSLLIAVPALNGVASEIAHVDVRWLVLAGALELASCASFVVVFRHFFARVPASAARQVAWTEMGSGALLPGGGVGSLAVGGWLLHLAGMPTREIVRRSSSLFFLTSAVNVGALIAGGFLLASGLSTGNDSLALAGVPIVLGASAIVAALTIAHLGERRRRALAGSRWIGALTAGISEAQRALRHPSWRLVGAIGYLGFDIAVLWSTLSAVGYMPPLAVLMLGYIIGYLANLIPIPGGVGVLEGGLAGTLILYGAPVTQAAAGVLVYHAIAFWIPSLGGLLAYRLLRRDLDASGAATPLLTDLSERPRNDQTSHPQALRSRRATPLSAASRSFPATATDTSSRSTGRAVAAHPRQGRRQG
jgi:uncharacterized membrane protein YbhN (UPF0104 family)